MKIILVTHERELKRPSNTGRLALDKGGSTDDLVERIVWSRVSPNRKLLNVIEEGKAGLLYPLTEAGGSEVAVAECESFILLDATWQEARKMFNRSPYLKVMPRVSLEPERSSVYRLRRNQKVGGLCTAECIIEILREKDMDALAAEIECQFNVFNTGLG